MLHSFLFELLQESLFFVLVFLQFLEIRMIIFLAYQFFQLSFQGFFLFWRAFPDLILEQGDFLEIQVLSFIGSSNIVI